MYQLIKGFCPSQNRTTRPGIDENVFSDPVLQEDCIAHVTKVSREEYSRFVSELLDRLGYSFDMVKYRQQLCDETDTICNRDQFKVVTTGGKGEGTALFYESDTDTMRTVSDVICADYPERFIHYKNITLFHTDRQETPPGYTRLRLSVFEGTRFVDAIRKSLTGSHYLSSQSFTNEINTSLKYLQICNLSNTSTKDTTGPSVPTSSKHSDYDNVTCFRCFCPDILKRWVSRSRCHGWPSSDTIHEISHHEGQAVPVGFKGSKNKDCEWRICYSLAELHLMRNCNDIQLKVYILLKKLSKSVLNPVCKDMTSYIMKNVVFWVCEANSIGLFSNDLLIDRLLDCIKYLRKCVSENNLPSYMIPERNLLAGRLDTQQSQQLTSLLGDLLHERGGMLMRCDKLRDAMIVMYKIPEMFREFGEKRDKLESLILRSIKLYMVEQTPGMSTKKSKEEYSYVNKQIDFLIKFDVQPLRQTGKTDKEIKDFRKERVKQLLS